MKLVKEITPLKEFEPFIVFRHEQADFNYPLHFHPEYELTLITNFKGDRIVGDSIQKCDNEDLVLIGPYLKHIWKPKLSLRKTTVVTIQFGENFLGECIKRYNMFSQIDQLLKQSKRGIHFGKVTKRKVKSLIMNLSSLKGVDALLCLIDILQHLSQAKDKSLLSSDAVVIDTQNGKSRRIETVIHYIKNHYKEDIKLKIIAQMANMSESAFSHFFKKRTQKSYTQYILDYRMSIASKLLLETQMQINEIAYKSGFKSLSNFNRLFKRQYDMSPKLYKQEYFNLAER